MATFLLPILSFTVKAYKIDAMQFNSSIKFACLMQLNCMSIVAFTLKPDAKNYCTSVVCRAWYNRQVRTYVFNKNKRKLFSYICILKFTEQKLAKFTVQTPLIAI